MVDEKAMLRRTVASCLLWEQTFYEDGVDIAARIGALVERIEDWAWLSELAIEARSEMNLRHAPLLICAHMARTGKLRAHVLARVIQRADELAEFVALFWEIATWKGSRATLTRQVKLGLAQAFCKFDEYQLAKYDRARAVRLRDVLFLAHPKPVTAEQQELWRRLIDGELEVPDTWEVALSSGEEPKREAWERLLREQKLGALALLRNLRNMTQAGVSRELIKGALSEMDTSRVLPFRFIAAARHAPWAEPWLEAAMTWSVQGELPGRTVVLVDHSGSMQAQLSARSDMTRRDAADGLAIIARAIAGEDVEVMVFSTDVHQVPPRSGFALRDAMLAKCNGGGTYLGHALDRAAKHEYDRIIVVTDEQAHDRVPDPLPGSRAYMVNVAPYRLGVGYGNWTHIDGFSESVFRFIDEIEGSAHRLAL
jgi:hypothetical protein